MTTHIALALFLGTALMLPFETEERPSTLPCCGELINSSVALPKHSPSPLSAAEAKQLFETFKKLEGKWVGKSTKDWTEEETIRVIANGSVVEATSFDAHPNETMLTLFHLDNDRLMLTHYCVARNQPRLVATQLEEDGKKVTFEFLDATNLPSRDKGHMDKVVYTFTDENTYTSQWTWYQNGAEQWMEKIINERVK